MHLGVIKCTTYHHEDISSSSGIAIVMCTYMSSGQLRYAWNPWMFRLGTGQFFGILIELVCLFSCLWTHLHSFSDVNQQQTMVTFPGNVTW